MTTTTTGVATLKTEDKELINKTLSSLYEKLTEVNKHPLKSHLAGVYLDKNGNHIHFDEDFYIGGTDEENCDVEGWFFATTVEDRENPYRFLLTLNNPRYKTDTADEEKKSVFSFAFPKKMMGMTGERRAKLCAWMVKETFQIFDAEELEFFIENGSVLEERVRFIDWETIFDNDPNMEKVGNGSYVSKNAA